MDDDLLKIASYVAHYMVGSWRVDTRPIDEDRKHLGFCILGENLLTIRIQNAKRIGKEGMLRIYGEIPSYGLNWQGIRSANIKRSSESINVSINKDPRIISSDIERRLIPDYLKDVINAEKELMEYQKKISNINNIENAFRQIIPSLSQYNRRDERRREYSFRTSSNSFLRSAALVLSVYDPTSCNLKLDDLPIDTAIRVLAMIKNEEGENCG